MFLDPYLDGGRSEYKRRVRWNKRAPALPSDCIPVDQLFRAQAQVGCEQESLDKGYRMFTVQIDLISLSLIVCSSSDKLSIVTGAIELDGLDQWFVFKRKTKRLPKL
jgi:hypothetical protein